MTTLHLVTAAQADLVGFGMTSCRTLQHLSLPHLPELSLIQSFSKLPQPGELGTYLNFRNN